MVSYIGSADNKLYAFDAAGHTGCSGGATKTCVPLWTAHTGDVDLFGLPEQFFVPDASKAYTLWALSPT